MTDPIKTKIQELCPDVMKGNCEEGEIHYCSTHREYLPQVLTLAVVLRAIRKTLGNPHGDNYLEVARAEATITGDFWNLEHDNYDDQTKETQLFVGSLLGVV